MLDTGESDLHPVVCLHSLFLDPTMFDALVEAGRERFRFVRPEFPGQVGRVDDASATVTMEDCAEDVLKTIDGLGLSSASLVAQSMGGDVALRIAAARPELVRGMVMMGTSAGAETPENIEAFSPLAAQIENEGMSDAVVDVLMQILFAKSVLDDPARTDIREHWRSRLAALSPNLAHAAVGVIRRESFVDRLPSIETPVLVVSGTEDVARPPSCSDEIFAGLPRAQLWRIKRAGHSPLLEAPGVVIPRVLDYLETPSPRA